MVSSMRSGQDEITLLRVALGSRVDVAVGFEPAAPLGGEHHCTEGAHVHGCLDERSDVLDGELRPSARHTFDDCEGLRLPLLAGVVCD
jgi:hypothetical protein